MTFASESINQTKPTIKANVLSEAFGSPKASPKPLLTEQMVAENGFTKLGLSEPIVSALIKHGYTEPTAVQVQAIPAALAGKDLLVSSPTGSGKTAAFMLPAIQRLTALLTASNASPKNQAFRSRTPIARPRLLVLTPTRELAVQVSRAADDYSGQLRRLKTVSILGGVPYAQQLNSLKHDPEIIVATPGRLIDYLNRRRIDLSQLVMLVLDEADRMLDMGFVDDIEKIISCSPKNRQTLLFSATIDDKIGSLTQRLMNSPIRVEVNAGVQKRENITQSMIWVDDIAHKDRLLSHLLSDRTLDQAIVFTATKSNAALLAARLSASGFMSAALHGDLPQYARTKTLSSLRARRLQVLVATDIAARGIDVPGITHVFNYDLPKFAEDYVHRIGRTGRAGRSGIAISLVDHSEMGAVKRIERFTRQPLPVSIVQGFEPRRPIPSKTRSAPGGRDGRPQHRNGQQRNFNSRSGAPRSNNNRGGFGDFSNNGRSRAARSA